ncbi:Molybdopterin oxidoreductase [Candidatus Magnetomoraceae bacterium gMMP-15]
MTENLMMINGREILFEPGQTILEAAGNSGIKIPTLCHLKGASPTGSCQICVVELHGSDELITACNTPAASNMVVRTNSTRVIQARKNTLELLLASGNHNCAISGSDNGRWTNYQLRVQESDDSQELCPVWGDCRLQDLAYEYNIDADKFTHKKSPYPMELANPLIIRDFSRCILCGRCVQACNEVQVNRAINFAYTGDERKVITKDDTILAESNCVFCGECIQACPVGALVEKKARHTWRPWKTEKIRTTCPYCGVGCQQMLHVQDGKIIKVTGVEDAEPNQGRLCVKGRFGYDFIYSEERLKTPLIKKDGELKEASWDEALDFVANKFKEIIAESGPDAIAGVSCARSINEDSYQMQKLFRAAFKTNNIDHCART